MKKLIKLNLKKIIDGYEKNNINEETQNNLIKYYENLNDNGEISISYSQKSDSCKRYYSDMFSLQNMFNEVLLIKIVLI